jgi:hypothetical protein
MILDTEYEQTAFDAGFNDALNGRPGKLPNDLDLQKIYVYGYWNGQNVRREYNNSDLND